MAMDTSQQSARRTSAVPRGPDAAVIFPDDAGKFPDAGSLSGKMVEVTGSVRLYHGKPEIIPCLSG